MIKAIRLKLGLTQESLAEALGVAKLTVSQYETGFRRPGATVLIFLLVVDSIPRRRALDLLDLFRDRARSVERRAGRSKP